MDLFNDTEQQVHIPGLTYIADFITQMEEKELLKKIDSLPWSNELSRRVQHYGYKYDYKKRNIDPSMYVGKLPNWADELGEKLVSSGLLPLKPDQLIINEYDKGQGIASHIDCEPCFLDGIVSLSLGSGCTMWFTHKKNPEQKIPLFLERRSLVVLTREARYEWLHGINKVKSDTWNGVKIPRERRVSLTFRRVIL